MVSLEQIRKIHYKDYIVYISFLLVVGILSLVLHDKNFLSYANIMNILRQTAMISVMAVGMTFAISAGEIDLSIGSIVGLAALVSALVVREVGLLAALVSGLLVGALFGFINGYIRAKLRIPSFLITLGTSIVIAGLARIVTNLEAIPITNQTFNFLFGSGNIGHVSTLFLWTIIVMVIGHIGYRKTGFGKKVLSVGGNTSAARFSGVNIGRIQMAVMTISGICAAFAGILYAGRLHGARYTLGESDLMSVIAAVVIGGTSFTGGKGTIVGSIIGSIVIGMLNNGLLLMRLSVSEQMIARGIVIILAVSLSLRQPDRD